MKTINLEKQLIKENKRLVTPEELLLINEYDKHAHLIDNDVLSRIGLNKQVKAGRNIKDHVSEQKKQTQKYNKDRVFHISQIKAICEKYHLKFLPVSYYKGIIDEKLPEKITTFEIAYNVECSKGTSYIVAPKNSFKLEEKPKDPLLFYQINNEYYYLIHKWGNDLNIFRRLLPYLARPFWSMIVMAFVFTLPFLIIPKYGFSVYCVFAVIILLVSLIFNSVEGWNDKSIFNNSIRLVDRNYWDDKYE
jgi:hypothetical protein